MSPFNGVSWTSTTGKGTDVVVVDVGTENLDLVVFDKNRNIVLSIKSNISFYNQFQSEK
jgi:hypothetical protein